MPFENKAPTGFTAQRQRELDRKALELVLALPDEPREARYVIEKVREQVFRWEVGERLERERLAVANGTHLRLVTDPPSAASVVANPRS